MTFNVCSDCGDNLMRGVLVLAFVWSAPTLIYVIRHQFAFGPVTSRALGLGQYVLVAAAILFSLWHFDLVDTSDPLLRLVAVLAVVAGAASSAAVASRRAALRGREERS